MDALIDVGGAREFHKSRIPQAFVHRGSVHTAGNIEPPLDSCWFHRFRALAEA